MVVGETVLANNNRIVPIGNTAPETPTTPAHTQTQTQPQHHVLLEGARTENDNEATSLLLLTAGDVGVIGDVTDYVQQQQVALVRAAGLPIGGVHDDGDVMCDQEMEEEEEGGGGGLWGGDGDESEEAGDESDVLSLVSSDRRSPTPPPLGDSTQHPVMTDMNHHSGHNGHLIITDLSDGEDALEEGEYDFGYTPTAVDYTQTGEVPPLAQHCLVSATVTGFTTEKGQRKQLFQVPQPAGHAQHPAAGKAGKGGADGASGPGAGLPDIVFIVELTWSDGRVNVVTRTYTDFCRLQYYLINEFVDVPANESPARLNIYLPVRRDVLPEDSFAQAHAEPQDSILMAESRELLLNQYVQELIKLPPKISASPTALTFFESRNSDPVPYRETVDTSRVNVTDQYILCWI